MRTDEYTITKSTVECYKLRHPSGMYWADITIDANGSKGRIQIASDFGDYQYYWGACGNSFKEFLAKIDIYYAAGKFGASDWFDHDGTIRAYKMQVLEERKSESITYETARKIYDEIKDLEEYIYKDEFLNRAYDAEHLSEFFGNDIDIKRDITPQFKKFWATCWQVLLNEFKREVVEI